jgi:hypothetical protein
MLVYYCGIQFSNSDTLKLQPYWDTCNATDHHDDISVSSESAWADNILGLNTCGSRADERPLAVEVDAYLLDSQFSTTTLNFWQVCRLSIIVYYDLSNYQNRKISFVFRPFSLMPWTFYPFKHPLYPLNEYSHLQRRQQQLDATSSALN